MSFAPVIVYVANAVAREREIMQIRLAILRDLTSNRHAREQH